MTLKDSFQTTSVISLNSVAYSSFFILRILSTKSLVWTESNVRANSLRTELKLVVFISPFNFVPLK